MPVATFQYSRRQVGRGIPDSVIEEVRARADLVEIVSAHTRLKRSGRTFRGPCPLHGGEGPNFSVDPEKNLFKCFVCGEGGDLFSFPMQLLGLDFLDAVRYVAERAGVEIPAPGPGPGGDPDSPHTHLYEANAFAAELFRKGLGGDEGGEARTYLEERGIGGKERERFGLGWALERWDSLLEAARVHGVPDQTLLELGLARRSRRTEQELYDSFRGRVIFPIEDLAGKVVGFGGRVLGGVGEHVPKYLNSPETPVFHKSELLYGLGWSKGAIRRERTALVVEGYMDYLSLAASGVANVVAPLGTALTPEQAALISRYAERAVLLYDSDKAGLRATFRSGDELLRAGVQVLVATLPAGEDPDSLVRSGGPAALSEYLDDAVDVLERKLQILERRGFLADAAGRRRAVDSLVPTVSATRDEALRDVYLARVSEKTGVSRPVLERETARDERGPPAAEPRRYRSFHPQGREADQEAVKGMGAERNILLLLLRDESWLERTARELSPGDFRHPEYRALYQGLLLIEGARDAGGEWLGRLPPGALPFAEELLGSGEDVGAPEQYFEHNLRRLQARPFEERLDKLQEELQVAGADQQLSLLLEWNELLTTMRERGLRTRYGTFKVEG